MFFKKFSVLLFFCSYKTVNFLVLSQYTVFGVSIKRTEMFSTSKFKIAILAKVNLRIG